MHLCRSLPCAPLVAEDISYTGTHISPPQPLVGTSWRLDETYIKVAGNWKNPYQAVDKVGDRVDFVHTAKRDLAAARRYLERVISRHGLPEKITIYKSGINTAAAVCGLKPT